MRYHLDPETFSISDLQKRIEETDLVPSRQILHSQIKEIAITLKLFGINYLSELRSQIKDTNKISAFSKKTNIQENIVILLRREIESLFPKPFRLKDINFLDQRKIDRLCDKGYLTTKDVYEKLSCGSEKSVLAEVVEKEFLEHLLSLASLTRMQWTSPLFAKMLLEAGYANPKEIANAIPEDLCAALGELNQERKYFKGTIGLRDIKRLIHTAKYVQD